MEKRSILTGTVALLCLMGCARAPAPLPLITSDFRDVSAAGVLDANLTEIQFDSEGELGGRVGFVAGRLPGGGVRAYAGIAPADTPTPVLPVGTGSYQARYGLAVISDFAVSDGMISGDNVKYFGDITLNANFLNGSITGTDGILSVDSRFTGTTLEGQVTYDGVTGDLIGVVGRDDIVGAFHGATDTTTFAGGFVGERVTD